MRPQAGLFDVAESQGLPKERSRWRLDGQTVIVRGQSPRMIWFTREGASALTQTTITLDEFHRRAVPVEGAR